jgi:hypothetical protein
VIQRRLFLMVCVLFAFALSSLALAGSANGRQSPACSLTANTGASLTFVNNTNMPVETYWIGYDCTETYYQTLQPGTSYIQPTYVTHAWNIYDAQTHELMRGLVAMSDQATIVSVDDSINRENVVCSESSDIPVTLNFFNDATTPIELYWLGYDCQPVLYNTLVPNTSAALHTFVGHPWVMRDALTNETLRVYSAIDTSPVMVSPLASDRFYPNAVCSVDSNTPATMTFTNTSIDLVELYWVDYSCQEVFYGSLHPGESVEQQTYVSHPWNVRMVGAGLLLKQVVAGATPLAVTIAPIEAP